MYKDLPLEFKGDTSDTLHVFDRILLGQIHYFNVS